MKDRLLKFMNSEQLSSARFAEVIGVQPSSISHILSGRNKPGFDFIQKILSNYPSLNAEWLILGRGQMHKQSLVQGELFSDINQETTKADNEDKLKDIDNELLEDNKAKNNYIEVTDVTSSQETTDYKSELGSETNFTGANGKKRIEKIVVLYSDNTFNSYSPEQSK
ncbi:MAG: XRE family transcriptional regulator [Marinilabiliales bacterium]|nr:MAG: XRE family transcriptional regulator [Marinilabiliales bacterium]